MDRQVGLAFQALMLTCTGFRVDSDQPACHADHEPPPAQGQNGIDGKKTVGFGFGMVIGILAGAVIDNMALGIILGCLLGFGIIRLPSSRA